MNLNIGITLNETITNAVVERLSEYDPTLRDRPKEDVVRKCTSARILAAVGSLTSIPVFLKIKGFADRTLLEQNDPQVMSRGMFVPLREDNGKLYIAVANPWDSVAEDSCAQKYPNHEIVRILAPAAEITSVIETVSSSGGPNRSALESIEVDETSDDIQDFNVSTTYDEPLTQFIAQMMSEAVKARASDVHIKTEKERVHYSYRVDGDMGEKVDIPMKLRDRLDAFLLNLMGIAPEERTKRPGISGRFTITYLRRSIDIRFERHRTYRGYHVTMRLLDRATSKPSSAWARWPSTRRRSSRSTAS